MKFEIEIDKIRTVNEIKGYWSSSDFVQLLDKFGYADAANANEEELKELLFMAITDFDPNESAAIILEYKLSEKLSAGQIDQLSHEMIVDNVAEEYADISLHYDLFNINQLLHNAYNGKFPNAKASIVPFKLKSSPSKEVSKELVLKVLYHGLSQRSLIKRLFSSELSSSINFEEAESIIWELHNLGNDIYELVTSDYWLNEEDFSEYSFKCIIEEHLEESMGVKA